MESNKFPYSFTLESAFTFGGLFSYFGAYYRNFKSYYRYYWFS
ncbi:hypothetical protein [Soonwooa sp.]|nr:hypothetical protein [Soonwooa sp.]